MKTPAAEIAKQLGLPLVADLLPRFNIAPSQLVPAVRRGITGEQEWAMFEWGLIPPWSKDPSAGQRPINARSETASQLPTFRHAFRQRRCLIIADGFYEWQRAGKRKQPFYIRLRGGAPFAMAGLWERWQSGPKQIESCTILTTTANSLLADLHHRMPVILQRADFSRWLDSQATSADEAQSLLAPYASEAMETAPVSDWVNAASHEGPQCLEPLHQAAERQQGFSFES